MHRPARSSRRSRITLSNFVKYAESFGAKGYQITAAVDLLPILRKALSDGGVSVIACPVDYTENVKLTDKLGSLPDPL